MNEHTAGYVEGNANTSSGYTHVLYFASTSLVSILIYYGYISVVTLMINADTTPSFSSLSAESSQTFPIKLVLLINISLPLLSYLHDEDKWQDISSL
jgi:hypothetical protein